MLVIHEDADEYYDSVHSTPTSTKKSLYEPEKETVLTIDKAQAIGEEYAHEQAKHLVLIGDVAANKAAPVSTQNWREVNTHPIECRSYENSSIRRSTCTLRPHTK